MSAQVQKLRDELAKAHVLAVTLVQTGEAKGAVRAKLLQSLSTAFYLVTKALDALAPYAK